MSITRCSSRPAYRMASDRRNWKKYPPRNEGERLERARRAERHQQMLAEHEARRRAKAAAAAKVREEKAAAAEKVRLEQEAERRAYQRKLAAYNGPPPPPQAIALVLERLRHEKALLARCMRVSPHFNIIAGQLLYEVLTLPDPYCHRCGEIRPGCCEIKRMVTPYEIPTAPEGLCRTSVAKTYLLDRTTGVKMLAHPLGKCVHVSPDIVGSTLDWAPEWVHVRRNLRADYFHHGIPHETRDSARSCSLIEWLCPQKVVFEDQSLFQPFPVHQRIPRSVKTLVTIITRKGRQYTSVDIAREPSRMSSISDTASLWRSETSVVETIHTGDESFWPKQRAPPATYPLHPTTAMLNHLVFIIHPSDCIGDAFRPDEVDLSNSSRTVEAFYRKVFQTIRQVRPRKATIVNPQAVIRSSTWQSGESKDDDPLPSPETQAPPLRLWDDPENIPTCMGEPSVPIELEVINLVEYLQMYEWTGEFDESRIRPWLEVIRRGRPPEPSNRERSDSDEGREADRNWDNAQKEPAAARACWRPPACSSGLDESVLQWRRGVTEASQISECAEFAKVASGYKTVQNLDRADDQHQHCRYPEQCDGCADSDSDECDECDECYWQGCNDYYDPGPLYSYRLPGHQPPPTTDLVDIVADITKMSRADIYVMSDTSMSMSAWRASVSGDSTTHGRDLGEPPGDDTHWSADTSDHFDLGPGAEVAGDYENADEDEAGYDMRSAGGSTAGDEEVDEPCDWLSESASQESVIVERWDVTVCNHARVQ